MNEELEDILFNALKNEEFTKLANKIIKKHGSKFLYNTYINSIKKYLFENEELFYKALLKINPIKPENNGFWLEAIKKPQFLHHFALITSLEHFEDITKLFNVYGKEFIKKTIKDFVEKIPKINFISVNEYLSDEHRQELKKHQNNVINEEYKELLNEYIINPVYISNDYEKLPRNTCPYCKEKLSKTTVPNIKGEYEACLKDKIIFVNMNQYLRILEGWTVNQLFKNE